MSETSDALARAQEFDRLVDTALDERQVQYGHPVFEHHYLRTIRVAELAAAYSLGGTYPPDRLAGMVDRAIDVKLQIYLAGEVIPGMMNDMYFDRLGLDPSAKDLVSPKLVLVALNQDLIAKSRILWDRIMGLVYFIETGKEDIPRSRRRSAKATFFEMCESLPQWRWLIPYRPQIDYYDDRFRTPELHKRSALRAQLMSGDDLAADGNSLLSLLNHALNVVWENITSIVAGGGVVVLGGVHISDDDESSFDKWGWGPGL